MSAPTIYREPGEETTGLYPGLVVCDGRVSGSITLGRTRLPIWAIHLTFDEWNDYEVGDEGMTRKEAEMFVHHLLQMRGEFGRLLLLLADAERRERLSTPWWYVKRNRRAIRKQLQRCLDVLGDS